MMPSISAHMVVAKEVSKKLNISSDDFIKENLLPDIINMEDSHHKIKGNFYMIPDIDYFVEKLDFSNDLYIGYLTHLLLDKHYLNDYLKFLYPNIDIFADGKIYRDYDYLNSLLIDKFELNTEDLEKILNTYSCKILEEKLKYNIDCLKRCVSGNTKYLSFENFSQFLLDISDVISKELISYANKPSKLRIRIR